MDKQLTPEGITLRQYYAGLAMQGLLSNPVYHNPSEKHKMITVPALCECATDYADALIKSLGKPQTNE